MTAHKLTRFGAIETAYRGFKFRSRLEAKYAVFFDLCGWQWTYEPFDLDGWIPDFQIGEHAVLVEIKPFTSDEEWSDEINKIHNSGYSKPVVCFGCDPTWGNANIAQMETPVIAKLLDPTHQWLEELHFGFTEGNDQLGLCPMNGGWWNVIWKAPANCNHPNKWSRVELKLEEYKILEMKWAQASNATRWEPKR